MKTSHGFHFLSYQLLLIEHFRFHLSYLLQQSKDRFCLDLKLKSYLLQQSKVIFFKFKIKKLSPATMKD